MTTIPQALQFMFAPGETPWAPLPDPGATPTTPLFGDPVFLDANPVTIDATATLLNDRPFYFNHYQGDFTNHGEMWVLGGTHPFIFTAANWGVLRNYGKLVAADDGYPGIARFWSWGVIENYGEIIVVGRSLGAAAVYTWSARLFSDPNSPDPKLWTPHINAGSIFVWSDNGLQSPRHSESFGFYFVNGAHLQNSGEIVVTDEASAYGVFFESGAGYFNNSGIVKAVSAPSGQSVGLFVNVYENQTFELNNTGVIEGDFGIRGQYFHHAEQPGQGGFRIENGGQIIGDIILYDLIDVVFNSGTINGNISLGSQNDVLDSSSGIITGLVNLGSGNDSAIGGSLPDSIVGAGGDDVIFGNEGADALYGGLNNDSLSGGSGYDTLRGGAGADTLNGGTGFDTLDYSDATGKVIVRLWNQTATGDIATGDVITGFERVWGGSAGDAIVGSDNVANHLVGNGGADNMQGLSGNDYLVGGAGNDTLTGGAGSDRFEFAAGFGLDRVTDFQGGAGDVIRLVGLGTAFDSFAEIMAATTQSGANAFITIGANTITLLGVLKTSLAADDFLFG